MSVQEATAVTTASDDATPKDPVQRIPSLEVLASELDQFKRTGRHLHLLHAVRALDDARNELMQFLHHEARLQPPGFTKRERLDERQQ